MLFFAGVSQQAVVEIYVFSAYINTFAEKQPSGYIEQNYWHPDFVGLSDYTPKNRKISQAPAMKLVPIFLLLTIGICGYSGKSLSGA